MEQTRSRRGGYRGKTGAAQTQAAREAWRNTGLERYSVTLYLAPEQVAMLRALEGRERSRTVGEALRLFSAEQNSSDG